MKCHQMDTQNLVISFDCIWFLAKNLAFKDPYAAYYTKSKYSLIYAYYECSRSFPLYNNVDALYFLEVRPELSFSELSWWLFSCDNLT